MSKEVKNEGFNIVDKIDEFFNLYDEIVQHAQEVHQHQADMDKELSNVYHMIEGVETHHVCESHKIFLHLKNVLNRRRMSKLPTHLIQSFVDNLDSKMKTTKRRHVILLDKHASIVNSLKKNNDVGKVFKELKIK
jgi:hypothetical protein